MFLVLDSVLLTSSSPTTMATANGIHRNPQIDLESLLSRDASMSRVDGQTDTAARPRWSTFDAPAPRYVVHVATEEDVARTVCRL